MYTFLSIYHQKHWNTFVPLSLEPNFPFFLLHGSIHVLTWLENDLHYKFFFHFRRHNKVWCSILSRRIVLDCMKKNSIQQRVELVWLKYNKYSIFQVVPDRAKNQTMDLSEHWYAGCKHFDCRVPPLPQKYNYH